MPEVTVCFDAERVSDGQDHIADLQCVGVGKRHHRQSVERDLQHRHIAFRVGAHHGGRRAAAIGQLDVDVASALDHVVVGQQETWVKR